MGPKNDCQRQNIENDKYKNQLAKQNGYRIIRVWGDEINFLWRIM